MTVTVYPAPLAGCIPAIPSKSHVHRLLIAAALAEGEGRIACPASSADIEATARCLRALGAEVRYEGGEFYVTPIRSRAVSPLLDCGESGSTLRFLLPVAACRAESPRFTGAGRLPARPLQELLAAMAENGVEASANALPLTLTGHLRAGTYTLPGDVSSQFISGLLLALPEAGGEIRLTTPLESESYVNLTRRTLRAFGVEAAPVPGGWHIPGGQRFRSPGFLAAEGDWSNAAPFLACGVEVTGLAEDSAQGDRAFPALLQGLGGAVDLRDTPDLLPILAVRAAVTEGVTHFVGAKRLRLKESDRLKTTAALINALGGSAKEEPEGLTITGGTLRGGEVEAAGDHRIVMAAAIAGSLAGGAVRIRGAEAVAKSYPRFFEDFTRLGGKVCWEKP
ncbi:MAG: 3-phosphoshikimate 1-carboxyvinyltransferase [bacterium]